MKLKVTDWAEPKHDERTTNRAVSLYPNQIAIIEALAKTERRSFSNALQVIVEQWYDAHIEDYDTLGEAA